VIIYKYIRNYAFAIFLPVIASSASTSSPR